VGTEESGVDIVVAPIEYLRSFDQSAGTCYLGLDPVGLASYPSTRLLGMGVLKKLVSVFDQENARMGFCNKL
jgi:hypothetical protein